MELGHIAAMDEGVQLLMSIPRARENLAGEIESVGKDVKLLRKVTNARASRACLRARVFIAKIASKLVDF